MSSNWRYKKSNLFLQNLQDNELSSRIDSGSYKIKAKAYLNPNIVNCEYIKRTLSKNCLQASNKIHVNPNFKGNRLNNTPKKIQNQNNNLHHVETNNKILSEPGPSNTSNIPNLKSKLNSFNSDKLNNATVFNHKSRFKKVNVNGSFKSKSTSQYSWSNGAKPDKTSSTFKINKKILIPDVKIPENTKQTYAHSENFYKYSSKHLTKLINKNCQSSKKIFKSKTKIINESQVKLLSSVSPKTKLNIKDKKIYSPVKKHLALSKFVYNNKISPITRVAKAVRTKYKYLNNIEQYKRSKYKIDKRNKLQESARNKLNVVNDIRKLFPNYFYNKVKLPAYKIYSVNDCHVVSKRTWMKNQLCEKTGHKIKNEFPNKRVVKIGGILYKSTTNKLTLANKSVSIALSKSLTDKPKVKKNHIVHVRGEKFILENNGKALRRLTQKKENKKTLLHTIKRVDIGGVTYIQKSRNVLIRTNVHRARLLVNKARNKSIALLANLHKKSSMPCMIYHRFGKCNRHTKGVCIYKHDSKNIAVCKNFLKGNCSNKNCLLSHEVIQEKMATCHFFLNGLCARENCPFLHVKLNKKVAICEQFLQGFCNLGVECPKRHFHQCPKFDKYGICNLGSKCHYPHKKQHQTKLTARDLSKCSNIPNDQSKTEDAQKKEKKSKKLIPKGKESSAKKVHTKGAKRKALCLTCPQENENIISCFPKRIRLDTLPCYIPLKSDS